MKVFPRKKPDPTRWIRCRILMVGSVLALCFLVIIARAVQLQVLEGRELSEKAEGQYKKAFSKMPRRGTIYDQNNMDLAVSIDVSSICAYPKRISSPKKIASVLARTLNVEHGRILEKLSSDKGFVWIQRHANPKDVSAVKALKLDGVGFVTLPQEAIMRHPIIQKIENRYLNQGS